jgi:hypothetical protein
VGVVEEALGVGGEVGQGIGRHAPSDARRPRTHVDLLTQAATDGGCGAAEPSSAPGAPYP